MCVYEVRDAFKECEHGWAGHQELCVCACMCGHLFA